MAQYSIPKEMKSKPRFMGLYMFDWLIVVVITVFTMSVLVNLVHSSFEIPLYIVVGVALLFIVKPSFNNKEKKNYESIYLLLKHDRLNYHPIDNNEALNEETYNHSKVKKVQINGKGKS